MIELADEDPDMFDALVCELQGIGWPATEPEAAEKPVNDPAAIAAFFAR